VRRGLAGRRPPAALVALLAVAAIAHLAWNLATPPMAGPDEDQHLAYVQRLVETREPAQSVDPGRDAFSTEVDLARAWGGLLNVPINPLAKPLASDVERDAYERAADALPGGARADGTGFAAANTNPPLYYLWASAGYVAAYPADLPARSTAMRLLGLPLLLVVVVCAWLVVAEVLPRPGWARVVGAGVVALQPLLAFMSGIVNPDIALAAAWSVFFVLAVRLVTRGPTVRRCLWLGLVCAASALVHGRGLTMAAPAVLALGVALTRWRPASRGEALRLAGALLGPAVLGLAVYVGLTRIGGGAAGGQLSGAVAGGFEPRQFLTYLWQFYFTKLRFMQDLPAPIPGFRYVYGESLFGVFGSLDVFLPGWMYDRIYQGLLYLGVALVVGVAVRWNAVRAHWREAVVLLGGGLTYVFSLHFAAFRALEGNGYTDAQLVGRYLLPVLVLFGVAVAFVATTLPGRFGRFAGLGALVLMVLLHVAGLGAAAARWYA